MRFDYIQRNIEKWLKIGKKIERRRWRKTRKIFSKRQRGRNGKQRGGEINKYIKQRER